MPQVSIGISIRNEGASLLYLKKTVKGIRAAAHERLFFEKQISSQEKSATTLRRAVEFMDRYRIPDAPLFLSIPKEWVISREILLPLAVKENLRSTLSYELEKYVPLPEKDICFDALILSEDPANQQMSVRLFAAKRALLAPFFDFTETRTGTGVIGGIAPETTATANFLTFAGQKDRKELFSSAASLPDPSNFPSLGLDAADQIPAFGAALKGLQRVPFAVDLLPEEYHEKPSRFGTYLLITLLVLSLLSLGIWGGSHILRERFLLQDLREETARLKQDVDFIENIRRKSSVLEEELYRLQALSGSYPYAIDVLEELSRIIPDTAWVYQFACSENEITIDGYADTSSGLIPIIENSLLFKDAVFLSGITKDRAGKERFRIGFALQKSGKQEKTDGAGRQ